MSKWGHTQLPVHTAYSSVRETSVCVHKKLPRKSKSNLPVSDRLILQEMKQSVLKTILMYEQFKTRLKRQNWGRKKFTKITSDLHACAHTCMYAILSNLITSILVQNVRFICLCSDCSL